MNKERRAGLLRMDASDLKTMAWGMGLTFKTDATKRNIVTAILEAERLGMNGQVKRITSDYATK